MRLQGSLKQKSRIKFWPSSYQGDVPVVVIRISSDTIFRNAVLEFDDIGLSHTPRLVNRILADSTLSVLSRVAWGREGHDSYNGLCRYNNGCGNNMRMNPKAVRWQFELIRGLKWKLRLETISATKRALVTTFPQRIRDSALSSYRSSNKNSESVSQRSQLALSTLMPRSIWIPFLWTYFDPIAICYR